MDVDRHSPTPPAPREPEPVPEPYTEDQPGVFPTSAGFDVVVRPSDVDAMPAEAADVVTRHALMRGMARAFRLMTRTAGNMSLSASRKAITPKSLVKSLRDIYGYQQVCGCVCGCV